MKQLERMENLTTLHLEGTRITDAGFAHLHSLKNLAELDLRNTAVSKEATSKFQEAVPNCSILRPVRVPAAPSKQLRLGREE